ncbi:hypothetical protein EBQ26_06105 [Allofranklinella schreckenbergeri]|uniref:Uncharacterized protein n=1 Tax=Allofranklinella schreckenbergeri TaxID=1076744 RepID=A0A3M6Q7B2_9BURK|nr:hypothetical protein EBQ26_06105 [Allofranklinella schreckenbergeri]
MKPAPSGLCFGYCPQRRAHHHALPDTHDLLLDVLRHGTDNQPNIKATWLSLKRLIRRREKSVEITQMNDQELLWFSFDAARQDAPAPSPPPDGAWQRCAIPGTR